MRDLFSGLYICYFEVISGIGIGVFCDRFFTGFVKLMMRFIFTFTIVIRI